MKPILLYLCLPAIVFHAIFASSSLNEESASLSTNKTAPFKSRKPHSKAKPIVGKLVCKKKLPRTKKKAQNKRGKSKNVLVKENESKLLIEFLLKELVEIVIGYFDDGSYPITISTNNWSFKVIPRFQVDNVRLYVIAGAEGIKGLDHSLANVKENERCLIEFGDPEWSNYNWFRSSCDGRYVSFNHSHKVLTDQGEQTSHGIKWLMQSNEPDDRRQRVMFDSKDSDGVLSRDGQTLCFYSYKDSITHVYRVREDAGKDPVAFMKFAFDGTAEAVSGKGNHVMISKPMRLEIHDISKDTSKLVCQFDTDGYISAGALNEDGSEVAFYDGGLRIMEVDKVSGSVMDQPAIVTVKVSESLGWICELVYSDEGKLHARHEGGKISLFDPSTKELVLLEAPQEEQEVIDSAISPNADYIAILRYVGKGDNGKTVYETIVKRKLNKADLKDIFGYEADMHKQTAKP